ncbi:hypothetical protein GCM10007231_20390 [Nocardioides daphniae]|uniref:Uncharacterized protein n=2 Tax=Nocardioides daphniae TaxID=402297 RepID=A0ABQ1QBZ9_9ACTN|nr:hypothetical protein GCM10007231_20390 [Nocardioides daphniae]
MAESAGRVVASMGQPNQWPPTVFAGQPPAAYHRGMTPKQRRLVIPISLGALILIAVIAALVK